MFSGIASGVGSISEGIISALKLVACIIVAGFFLVAINTLISLVTTFVIPPIVKEVFDLLSMFLPFNIGTIMGALSTILSAILSFKIARKIFSLTTWTINAS